MGPEKVGGERNGLGLPAVLLDMNLPDLVMALQEIQELEVVGLVQRVELQAQEIQVLEEVVLGEAVVLDLPMYKWVVV